MSGDAGASKPPIDDIIDDDIIDILDDIILEGDLGERKDCRLSCSTVASDSASLALLIDKT